MKKVNFKRNALMAGFGLALALTFSCSSEGGEVERGTLFDERNNIRYETVVIGDREWMAENLRYNNTELYDWATAMGIDSSYNNSRYYSNSDYRDDFEPHKGICPRGWYIPSDEEWNALITAVGGLSQSAAKLKSEIGWKSGNGSDEYGFKALPNDIVNEVGNWWSLTEKALDSAYSRRMVYNYDFVSRNSESKAKLFSVRCAREHIRGSNASSSSSGGYSSSSSKKLIDDRDGKIYNVVDIGTQTWMAENLDYRGDRNSLGACYERKTENCDKYGRLYSWIDAMMACPEGWHLPSEAEWTTLLTSVGGVTLGGKQLKSASGWENNGNGTDFYGFKALPGGGGLSGNFNALGHSGIWWSETSNGFAYSVNVYINNNRNDVGWDSQNKQYLFSVRCIMD